MAYEETPKKKIEVREGQKDGYSGHDALIDKAKAADKYNVRTDMTSEEFGFLGMDDLDRIRRRKLK